MSEFQIHATTIAARDRDSTSARLRELDERITGVCHGRDQPEGSTRFTLERLTAFKRESDALRSRINATPHLQTVDIMRPALALDDRLIAEVAECQRRLEPTCIGSLSSDATLSGSPFQGRG